MRGAIMYQFATGAQPYELETQPTQYPVSVADLRNFLKLNHDRENNLLSQLIATATKQCEDYTKKDFIAKDYITYRDQFGDMGDQPNYVGSPPTQGYYWASVAPIVLRKSPLISITEITYLVDGAETTLDPLTYRIVKKGAYSQIIPTTNNVWATADNVQQAITIKFKAGYGDPKDVPSDIKSAIMQICADLYTNRGDDSGNRFGDPMPQAAKRILNSYVIPNFRA